MQFIGIDGCKSGWFYVQIDFDMHWNFGVVYNIRELASQISESVLTLIDIPIGLRGRQSKERLCDTLARRALKPKTCQRISGTFQVLHERPILSTGKCIKSAGDRKKAIKTKLVYYSKNKTSRCFK